MTWHSPLVVQQLNLDPQFAFGIPICRKLLSSWIWPHTLHKTPASDSPGSRLHSVVIDRSLTLASVMSMAYAGITLKIFVIGEASNWNNACLVFLAGGAMQNTSAVIEANEFGEVLGTQVTSESFGRILSGGLPSLYRGAHRLLGNRADAEDAVQDALLAAYTHLDQFRGQAKMSTWLGAIVHNSARMQLRKRLRYVHVSLDEQLAETHEQFPSQRLTDRGPSPEEKCRNGELSERIAHFQNQLTPTLRKTFQLRDIDGLSIREAAGILGVPLGTVKAQSARARRKLRQLMRRSLRPQSRNLMRRTERRVSAKVSA
jgi:RNA polymerase sigma-70 factor, ECF subfamily